MVYLLAINIIFLSTQCCVRTEFHVALVLKSSYFPRYSSISRIQQSLLYQYELLCATPIVRLYNIAKINFTRYTIKHISLAGRKSFSSQAYMTQLSFFCNKVYSAIIDFIQTEKVFKYYSIIKKIHSIKNCFVLCQSKVNLEKNNGLSLAKDRVCASRTCAL